MACKTITLVQGDTLYALAIKYQTTVHELISLNPGIDSFDLIPGHTLCVPQEELSHCPIGAVPYQIKAGDNLYDLAGAFYTTQETIIKNNPNLDPNHLIPGEVICITEKHPEVPACPSMNIYVINPGDTFYSIAQNFQITVYDILNVNPDADSYNLQPGKIICLPLTPTPYIIVVNQKTKTMHLYYLGNLVKTYPVAVGKPSTPSPVGDFYIFNKQVNPGGPFGTRWMGLSEPHYGIHGTNEPSSIGTAASDGCIRMHNPDVEELFSKVSINTPVVIQN